MSSKISKDISSNYSLVNTAPFSYNLNSRALSITLSFLTLNDKAALILVNKSLQKETLHLARYRVKKYLAILVLSGTYNEGRKKIESICQSSNLNEIENGIKDIKIIIAKSLKIYDSEGLQNFKQKIEKFGRSVDTCNMLLKLVPIFKEEDAIISSSTDDESKFNSLKDLSEKFAKKGLYKDAERIANMITKQSIKIEALDFLVKKLACKELFKQAEAIARSITTPPDRNRHMLTIVSERLRVSGLFKQSERVARSILLESHKSYVLGDLSLAVFSAGLIEEATRIANTISDEEVRSSALAQFQHSQKQANTNSSSSEGQSPSILSSSSSSFSASSSSSK